ncbi:MAG TPA: M20 family peptidase [Cyclobacteriaceae bacterium]|nr:M20 family peptidase [Cyclobacteriaceae bacterium]
MKKIFLLLFILVIVLVGVLLFNTLQFKSKQLDIEGEPSPEISETAVENFQKAIRIKTISFGDSIPLDTALFYGFHRFLESTYPLVHEKLEREKVKDYSLLYKWHGKNPNANPIVLMAHMDVVPIEPGTESVWSVDPFEGVIENDTIWGRGTADDKMSLIAIMEAIEKLLAENFVPERTIYLSFGHDEEIGGQGAIAIAALLESRNIKADLVLDEGGIITIDKIPGITQPVALVGTSEKGYMSLQLSVELNGGHSSMPAPETAIDILINAIARLRANPFEADFSQSTKDFIQYIGPEQPFLQKMVFANQGLFKNTIVGIYEKSPGGNAMVRTTIAPTVINAGVKDNVIPTLANAVINFRILPGDTQESVKDRVVSVIADPRVKISKLSFGNDPSAVTPVDGFGFKLVETAARKTFDKVIVAPFLMVGATDSRHFGKVSDQIIKFSPMNDPIGFHGIDERISVKGFKDGIGFYQQLIKSIK